MIKGNMFVAVQVKEVYGGEGKVKVKKKSKNRVFSFKYTGPERAAKLLEGDASLHMNPPCARSSIMPKRVLTQK